MAPRVDDPLTDRRDDETAAGMTAIFRKAKDFIDIPQGWTWCP
jgi:hypothetical protein